MRRSAWVVFVAAALAVSACAGGSSEPEESEARKEIREAFE